MIPLFKIYLIANGLFLTSKDNRIEFLSVTNRPTFMNKMDFNAFKKIKALQTIINKLIHSMMSKEHESIDDNIYTIILNKIRKAKYCSNIKAIFIRSDYLFEQRQEITQPIQVEINTISCAFTFSGPAINRTHALSYKNTEISESDDNFLRFVKMLLRIFLEQKEYISTQGKNYAEECPIAIMVDDDTSFQTSNFSEKCQIITRFKQMGIDMLHLTFDDIRKNSKFVEKGNQKKEYTDTEVQNSFDNNKKLPELEMFYNEKKVFFIYYRWFYNEAQYKEKDILLRTKIESSTCISLPTVELQIVGLKIFQLRLTNEDYLKKFLNEEECEQVRSVFGEFIFPENINWEKIRASDYVLKNLQEGGGNNIYGDEILRTKNYEKKFLMKKIIGKEYDNRFLKNEMVEKSIPEIGIMGSLISVNDHIIFNEESGYICRSKDINSDECGVSCGFGALDSIMFEQDSQD